MRETEQYPRPLREKERDLIQTVLPVDRPGYSKYRDLISSMVVLGAGRRGKGNIVMGFEGDVADTSSPLAPVIAYGMVETTADEFSITVREFAGDQIDVEIVSSHDQPIGDHFEEKRRWTYSSWLPGLPSPGTGAAVREIEVEKNLTLALCKEERRVWIHDSTTGMNILVPITHYYGEIMKRQRIRDPKIALDTKRLFTVLETFSDDDLRSAFIAYNEIKPKVAVTVTISPPKKSGWKKLVSKILGS